MIFTRNNNIFAKWWWTIDKKTLAAILLLIIIGIFLSFSASPSVSAVQKYESYHYVIWHMFFSITSIFVMFVCSLCNVKIIRRGSIILFMITLVMMLCTLFMGENKGASRWIRVLGLSLQPSEFIKPLFAVFTAWILDIYMKTKEKKVLLLIGLFLSCVIGILLKQPDVGTSILIICVCILQLGVSTVPLSLIIGLGLSLVILAISAFFIFDHVHNRVVALFASDGELGYQVKNSLKAFQNGGIFGKGAGEGVVRSHIPDSHTDFVFSVAGEEYGMIFCMVIIGIIAFIVIKNLLKASKENNAFIVISIVGLVSAFGIQGIINMCSATHLGPTKGMTLPFISYGGSATWASAMQMGILLALTRKNVIAEEKDETYRS